jgi:hypothetical protein
MRSSWKTSVPLCIVLSLLCLSAGNITPVYADPQPGGGNSVYLPIILQPGFIYLPLVSVPEVDPTVPVGLYGGSIVAIADDAVDPNTVYAGSWGAGVFVSHNRGSVWYSYNTGLENMYIDSLAVDPTLKGVVYAGTHGNGVYKSVDGGKTWAAMGGGMQANAAVYTLAVNFNNHQVLYAGTRDVTTNIDGPWHGILYRSTNGGTSWSAVLQNIGSSQDWVYSIAADPVTTTKIYATSHEHGPYLSVDNGATWTSIANSSVDTSGRAVAVDPRTANDGTAYYGTWHLSGVYKTANFGTTWSSAGGGLNNVKVYPNGIDVAPSQPDVLYLADFNGHGVWKSTNAGGGWDSIGLVGDEIYSVAASKTDAATVLAGLVNRGVIKSTDGGANWASTNFGFVNSQVTGVTFTAGKIFMSVIGQGVFSSHDAGQSWQPFNQGLDDLQVNGLVSGPQGANLLLAMTDSGLYRLDLNKGTWQRSADGSPSTALSAANAATSTPYGIGHPFTVPLPDAVGFDAVESPASNSAQDAVLSVAIAPSDANVGYMGKSGIGVFTSHDGGASWSQMGLNGQTVWSLAVDPADAQHVYAATASTPNIQESVDGGKTWTPLVVTGAGVKNVYCLAYSSGQLLAGTDSGLWKLSGGDWQAAGLSGMSVTTLAANGQDNGSIVAGTTSGAYQSADNGGTWQLVSAQLSGMTIRSIGIDPVNPSTVYLGTTVRGAYKSKLSASAGN